MKNWQKTQFINAAFALALAILVIIGWLSYRNTAAMIESDQWEDNAYATIQEYDGLVSALQNEEIGLRGYIITGKDDYLEPADSTLKDIFQRLAALTLLTKDNPQQQNGLKSLKTLIDERTAEVKEGTELRRIKGFEAGFGYMITNKDQELMDEIGRRIAQEKAGETRLLRDRAREKTADARRSIETVVAGSCLSFLLLFAVFVALKKEISQRVIAETELFVHREHLQERINERTMELGRANALLQNEIMNHKETEQALRQAQDELESRIKERTAELAQTVTVLHDEVIQRSLAEQTLRERSDELSLLASELTMAEQRERERLAQVLHDDLQQILVGAKYRLALVGLGKDASEATEEVVSLIDNAIDTSRSLTSELSPPILRQSGLVPALEWLACWVQAKYGLIVNLTHRKPIESPSEGIAVFLFQATRELLFNVVKHAGVNAVSVEIEQQEGQIQIAVADQGAGFDPAQLRTGSGTPGGFGLFSLIERINRLGGRMEIDSSPGKGSRITLFAPLSSLQLRTFPQLAEKQGPVSSASQKQTPLDSKEKRIRVVLVDDHMVVRQGLTALLGEQPYLQIVGEASDGQSALRLIRQIRPDVVLMDIGLPDISGIEVTQILHKELPDVHIIGLSMLDGRENAAAMRTAGAVDYVSKSEPSEAVIAAIRACIPVPEQIEKKSPGADSKPAGPAATAPG
jgi:signal transduction histidine kinase/ActR/RegA family two-component response regulator